MKSKFKLHSCMTTWLQFVLFYCFSSVLTTIGKATNDQLNFLHLLDDQLMYRIAFKPAEDYPHELEEKETNENKIVKITSNDLEKYRCVIPRISVYSKKRIESYLGPTPAQLLQSIYEDNICSYKFETYWNYELCHGRFVLQYHEEKETKQRTEYFLGSYMSVSAAMEAKSFDQLNPPTKKIGDEMRPFYPVTYTHGTVCDITGKSRQTVVMYVCDEDARQNIYSFTEVSSCKYEVIVLSSELCAHPAFQVIPHKEHEISCFPVKEDRENPKPRALIKVEEDTERQFMKEYGLFKDFSSAKSAKQIFSKLFQVEEEVIENGFDQLNQILESFKKVVQHQRSADSSQSSESKINSLTNKQKPQPQSPHIKMQKIVNEFWQGNVCLHGGTGWWQYEVCYGKAVNQYHAEINTKARQNILLGLFNKEVHKSWANEHREKVIERRSDGRIMQIVNMYTQGDICTENGAHRSCEVRIRCRDDNTAPKIFIYMLEPSTCQYIVVLESLYFCDVLQKVDEFGLLSDEAQIEIGQNEANNQDSDNGEEQDSETKAIVYEEYLKNSAEEMGRKQKTKVEINIMNQDDLMRIMQNFLNGMGREGDRQMVLDVTKIFTVGDDKDEKEDMSGQQEDSDQTYKGENSNDDDIKNNFGENNPGANGQRKTNIETKNEEKLNKEQENRKNQENTNHEQRYVNEEL